MATESLKVGRAWDDEFHGWTAQLQLGRREVAQVRRDDYLGFCLDRCGQHMPIIRIRHLQGFGQGRSVPGYSTLAS